MPPNGGSASASHEDASERLLARVRPPAGTPVQWTAELATDAAAAFAPLLCGKENSSGGGSSARLGGAAAGLLRAALASLDGEAADAPAGPASRQHLLAAACDACDALTLLGPSAFGSKARPQEVALQRYALARKLVAKGCHTDAAHHAAAVLFHLAGGGPPPPGAARLPPPLPPPPGGPGEDVVTLGVGAALCFAGASAEGRVPQELQAAVAVARSLPPWLSLTDTQSRGRHYDALFRYLCKLCFALSPTSGEAATAAACAAVRAGCQAGSSAQRVLPAALKMAAGLPALGAARVCLDAACEAVQHLGNTAWGDAATGVDAAARYAAACDVPARASLGADMTDLAAKLEATPAACVLHTVARLQAANLALSGTAAAAACDAASAALRALPRAAQPAALRACARAVDTLRRGAGASGTDLAASQLCTQLAVFAADAMAALPPSSDAAVTAACAGCAAACLAAGAAAVRANATSFASTVCDSAAAVVRHPAVTASPDALRVIAVAFAGATSAVCSGSDAPAGPAAACAAIARDATQERACVMTAASATSPEAADAMSAACAAAVALSDALWRGQQPVEAVVRPLARAAAAWHSHCPQAHLERLATRYVRYIGVSVSADGGTSSGSQDDVTASCTAAPAMHALAVDEACATGSAPSPGTVSAVAAAELTAWMAHGRAWSLPRCQALAHAAAGDASAPPVLHGAALMAQAQFLRAVPGQAPAAREAADGAAAAFSACGAEAQHAHALALGAVCGAEAGDGAGAFQERAGKALTALAHASAAGAPCHTWLALLADVAAALGDSHTWQAARAAVGNQGGGSGALPATLLACLATAPHLPDSWDTVAPRDAADGLAEALSALRVADDGTAPAEPAGVDPSGEEAGDQTQPAADSSSPVHAALVLLRRAGAAAASSECLTALASADAACRLLSPSQLRKAGGAHRWGVAGLYIATCACVAACAEACGFDSLAEHALADADSAAASLGLAAVRGALHVRMASLRRRQHGWEAAEAACEAADAWLAPAAPAAAPCPELQLMRAELARVKGDIARRKPRSALAALRSADGGAGDWYAAACAQAQALAPTPGALGRAARQCVARAMLGTAKCVAARCLADAAISTGSHADGAAAHAAALGAATPHLQAALAALSAPPLDSGAGHTAHSDSPWDEAAVLVTAARLQAATHPASFDARSAVCGSSSPAAPALVAPASRRGGSRGASKAQPTAAAASPAAPAVGPLLDRARVLASGAPCLLRAVCACVGAAKAREGSAQACVQALHTSLGAAACAEARYALATAAMSVEDGGGAAPTNDVASALEVLRTAEDSHPGGPPPWRHLLAAPPLDTGGIVTLSVADSSGMAFAGVPASAPGARLVLTRVEAGSPGQPLVVCLPAPAMEAGHPLAWGAAELRAVLQESDACRAVSTETEAQKRAWWAARLALDARLTGLCAAMDAHWLGAWRAALQGAPGAGSAQAAQAALALQAGLARLPPVCRGDTAVAAAMAVLARGAATGAASAEELARALGQLGVLPAQEAADVATDMLAAAAQAPAKQPRGGAPSRRAGASRGGEASSGAAPSSPRGPVLLLLDSSLTALPWESMPGLAGQRISRAPSLGLLAVSLAARGGRGVGVDLRSAYFLLNPGGDLPATQARLQPLLASQTGWDGVAGSLPGGSKALHAAKLAASPLFLYFGHGAGTQFLPSSALRLRRCATTLALLMGCSSGALVPRGDFPPSGAALAYLAAGCASLVANLWDVTDKDIDRFAEALLQAWLQHAASDAGGQQGPGAGGAAVHTGLEDARRACKLRALTGAAPVCYGLPTLLQATGELA